MHFLLANLLQNYGVTLKTEHCGKIIIHPIDKRLQSDRLLKSNELFCHISPDHHCISSDL